MRPTKDLFVFLGLEMFSVVWAAAVFSLLSNKVVAGGLAGAYFLVFSSYMLFRILKWPKWWEAWTIYPLMLFLFGCTVPMLWVRFTHLGQSFNDVRILGIPGPEFHHVSSSTLGLLFLVTLAETVKSMFKRKAA